MSNADQSAVLVNSAQLNDIFVESNEIKEVSPQELGISPNPTIDGWLNINTSYQILQIDIYNLNGQLIKSIEQVENQVQLPEENGVYLLKVQLKDSTQTTKIIRM